MPAAPICEKWYNYCKDDAPTTSREGDVSTYHFVFATEMRCDGDLLHINYYLDEGCSEPDPLLPTGVFQTPYTETVGYLAGNNFECASTAADFRCENNERVQYGVGDFTNCHGGCGAMDRSSLLGWLFLCYCCIGYFSC
jgi:hypothetical protein